MPVRYYCAVLIYLAVAKIAEKEKALVTQHFLLALVISLKIVLWGTLPEMLNNLLSVTLLVKVHILAWVCV